MLTTINVTFEDIHDGIARSCGDCPIALAAKRVILPEYCINVIPWAINIRDLTSRTLYHRIDTPEIAYEFIRRFDDDYNDVISEQPFSFEVDIPEKYLIKV